MLKLHDLRVFLGAAPQRVELVDPQFLFLSGEVELARVSPQLVDGHAVVTCVHLPAAALTKLTMVVWDADCCDSSGSRTPGVRSGHVRRPVWSQRVGRTDLGSEGWALASLLPLCPIWSQRARRSHPSDNRRGRSAVGGQHLNEPANVLELYRLDRRCVSGERCGSARQP